jgi:hypothetical protein
MRINGARSMRRYAGLDVLRQWAYRISLALGSYRFRPDTFKLKSAHNGYLPTDGQRNFLLASNTPGLSCRLRKTLRARPSWLH